MTPENRVKNAVLKYLNAIGIKAWRRNVGAFSGTYGGKRRFVKFGEPGQSDIAGILSPTGRVLEVECKAPGKLWTLTEAQTGWIMMINSRCGVAFVAQSIDDVNANLRDRLTPAERECLRVML